MLKIVPFHKEHAQAAAELHASSFPRPWATKDMESYATRGDIIGVSALKSEAFIGFSLALKTLSEADILTIATSVEYRNQGIGKELLKYILNFLLQAGTRNVFLEAAEDNQSAKSIYRQAGFNKVGERPAYYPSTQGQKKVAYIYKKCLLPPLSR